MAKSKVRPGNCRAVLAVLFLCLVLAAPASAAEAPIVAATWVTNVTATSADLHARINPNGAPSTYRFEYVEQSTWEGSGFAAATVTPPSGSGALGSGTEFVVVTRHIAPLTPTTSYRYRVRATNGTETFGTERILTTEVPTNVVKLPDGRAWEMVSPADKGGGAIAPPETLFGGGAFQAAANGVAITYGSPFSFAGGGGGALGASQYVSSRSTGGWSTQNISTPMLSGSFGDEPDGTPYRLFSPTLSALVSNGVHCRNGGSGCPVANPPLPGSGAPAGFRNYYLRNPDGSFQALLTASDIAGLGLGAAEFELALAGATPDLSHVVLSSCAALTADATETAAPGGCKESEQNLYEWNGGGLTLINLLPAQSTGTTGAVLAAPAGAISSDGSRVYFALPEAGPLYLRDGSATKLVPETAAGGATFQVASSDGRVAFFTKAGALYRYDVDAGTSLEIAAGVKGVLGAAADGSYAYFQDGGGLQQWHNGAVTQIAAGADATLSEDFPPATGTARVSADGKSLAFLSAAELTEYENVDVDTGEHVAELYLFRESPGGAGTLICASCNPTGERPEGAASIPGAQANGSFRAYKPRVLSASGARLFFDTDDKLVVSDTNSAPDVYEWEAAGTGDCALTSGCIGLISEARVGGAVFLDASASGDDVFFLTAESLVGTDPGAVDVYDAKVGGGLPEPPKPFVCLGDACQPLPSPPDDPTPGTQVPNGGNPPLHIDKKTHKGKKHKHKGKKNKGKKKKHGHRRGARR
jgi:hypothetical protein